MKILQFIFLIICLSWAPLKAQWSVGTNWIYADYSLVPPFVGVPPIFEVSVIWDSSSTDYQYFRIKRDTTSQMGSSEVELRYGLDKLWFWADSSYRLLYDFTLAAGDTMRFEIPQQSIHYDLGCGDTSVNGKQYAVLVDSVSVLDVFGVSLKQLHTSILPDSIVGNGWALGTITERLGSEWGFFGFSETQCLGGYTGALCSYQDSEIGTYFPNGERCLGPPHSLDAQIEPLIQLRYSREGIEVIAASPNAWPMSISLYNLQGQAVLPNQVFESAFLLSSQAFPEGIYLLRVEQNGRYHQQKISLR